MQAQQFTAAQAVNSRDFHQREQWIVPDAVQERLHLFRRVEMRFMPWDAGQVDILAGIGGQQTGLNGFRQRLIQNVLVQAETAGRQAAFAVLAPMGGLFVHVILQKLAGHLLQLQAAGIKIRKNVTVGQTFIALIGHLIHPALYLGQPGADKVGKGHIAGNDTLLPFICLDRLAEQLFRPALVALYRQVRSDPFLPPFTACVAVENDIVLVIFDLQTSCHNSSFPDS